MFSLPGFSIRHPVSILMVLVAVAGVGFGGEFVGLDQEVACVRLGDAEGRVEPARAQGLELGARARG